jgi:hypothetical protein
VRASKEARVRERWREQAARLVALALTEDWHPTTRGLMVSQSTRDLLHGMHFNVARVRAYCERLIAEGERLAEERVLFMDWTRTQGRLGVTLADGLSMSQGLGPENRERGAFRRDPCEDCGERFEPGCRRCDGVGHPRGGWPGSLAREWGTVRCEACEGKHPCERDESLGCQHHRDGSHFPECKALRCKPCKGRGYVPRPGASRSAAAGPGLARTARRLLDTLDGRCPWAPSAGKQASECQECDGHGSEPTRPPTTCEACHGTGHNLSGALPAVEWSPALLRKLEDMREGDGLPEASDWVDRLIAAGGEALSSARVAWSERHPQTRVVPRGEHVRSWILVLNRTTTRILPDDDDHAAHVHTWLLRRELPRWRRGELKHSEQRRERARRQAMETIAQSTPYTVEELFEGNDRFRREIADRTHRGSSADADRMLGERAEDLERLAAALDMPVAEVRDHVRAAIVGAPGDVT